MQREIYFSYSAWNLLKDCPYSYKLRYVDKVPTVRDGQNAIQGNVPGKQAEDFFRFPIDRRNVSFFLETFDHYWNQFTVNSMQVGHDDFIDWHMAGQRLAKKKKMVGLDRNQLIEFAIRSKYEETKSCSAALASLITLHGFAQWNCETEVPFKMTIHPDQASDPTILIGGRLDLLLFGPEDFEEIWDFKATKDPPGNADQLLFYAIARRAMGKKVQKTGFILMKLGRIDERPLTEADEDKLIAEMRKSSLYFDNNYWPANYRKWKCEGYCDMAYACPTAQRNVGR